MKYEFIECQDEGSSTNPHENAPTVELTGNGVFKSSGKEPQLEAKPSDGK